MLLHLENGPNVFAMKVFHILYGRLSATKVVKGKENVADGCVGLKSVRHSSQRLKPKTYVWIFSLVLYLPLKK